MRLVMSGGGTGGHVYPALAVSAALAELVGEESLELLYLGTTSGVEAELLERTAIPFRSLRASPMRGRSPWGMALAASNMAVGTQEAVRIMAQFRPDAVLTTGGYVSVPVAMAARLRHTPLVVFLPDVRPGWAVSLMVRLAQKVATTTEGALSYLPRAKTAVTGYPVRSPFWAATKEEARRRLGLCLDEPVLLVAGGSLGAHRLNETISGSLRELLAQCQLVHVCGRDDEPWLAGIRQQLPDDLRTRYHLSGYLYDDMPWAAAAADLAVVRAGASVMGELPALGLPAIVVPYPFAGGHQRYNAQYLASAGAAVELDDARLVEMPWLALELLHDDGRRQTMATAARGLARPEAAHDIARIILEVAA